MRDTLIVISSIIIGAALIGFMYPAPDALTGQRYIALMDEIKQVQEPLGYRQLWDTTRGLVHRVKMLEQTQGFISENPKI